MLVRRTSSLSGKTRVKEIPVTHAQLDDWANGTLIQDAMPNLTPDEREFIQTGSTKEEWDQIFEGAE